MAKQTINLGTAPTGTGGDTPRSAFTKVQSNFDEIYNAFYAAKGANGDITSLTGLTTALSVAQGGTGVTSIAALLTALQTAGALTKSNLVGTVSQSGGVPTGAAIETGSNANGTYIKFADGTMICRQTIDLGSVAIANAAGTLYASTSQAGKAFAAAFSAYPTCHISLISSNATAYAGTVGLPTVSASQAFYVIAPAAAAQSITAVIIAIGRWF